MYLILAHASDHGAREVAVRLGQCFGAEEVRLLRPEVLGLARWSHRVDARGRASTRLVLPGGEILDSGEISAVLNRTRFVPSPNFRRASPRDRDYAFAEMQALIASWLAGFGDRVVPSVRRHHTVTPILPRQRWMSAASAAGLPLLRRQVFSSRRRERFATRNSQPIGDPHADGHGHPGRPGCGGGCGCGGGGGCGGEGTGEGALPAGDLMVVGDAVSGSLAAQFENPARLTARALGFPLMEFRFGIEEGAPVLCDVDPLPPLTGPGVAGQVAELMIHVGKGITS